MTDLTQRRLELWFMRDLLDGHRKTLFSVCGLPMPETLTEQQRLFRSILGSAGASKEGAGL